MRREKQTALQRLRIARAHREAEMRAPLEQELAVAARVIRDLKAESEKLRRFMAHEICKYVLEEIGRGTSNLLKTEIVKALSKAGRPSGGIIQMEFAADELKWLDPDSIERRVLADWKERSAPRLRVTFPADGMIAEQAISTIDVRLPEMGYRRYIADYGL